AHVVERNGSGRGSGMDSTKYDSRVPLPAISKLLNSIRRPLSNEECGQIFTSYIWPTFIETKADGSSYLSEFFACWRASLESALSVIRGRISTSQEPPGEERRAVQSFDTRGDAVTVRFL